VTNEYKFCGCADAGSGKSDDPILHQEPRDWRLNKLFLANVHLTEYLIKGTFSQKKLQDISLNYSLDQNLGLPIQTNFLKVSLEKSFTR
jgi:hypothetical protein